MTRAFAVLWVGCQADPRVPVAPTRPTFSTDGLDTAPWCAPDTPDLPLGAFTLAPVRAPEMPPGAATTAAEAAARVWERLGATVQIQAEGVLRLSPAIDSTSADPYDALAGTRAVLGSLAPGPLYVAVLPALFVPSPPAGADFRGLTFSSLQPDPLSRDLLDGTPYPPLVLLDGTAGPRAPGDLSLTPAHEVGHALGLSHPPKPQGLMADGPLSMRCLPSLSLSERDTVRQNLAQPSLVGLPPSVP